MTREHELAKLRRDLAEAKRKARQYENRWDAFDGGNHMARWIYSHGVRAHYERLLTQSRSA